MIRLGFDIRQDIHLSIQLYCVPIYTFYFRSETGDGDAVQWVRLPTAASY